MCAPSYEQMRAAGFFDESPDALGQLRLVGQGRQSRESVETALLPFDVAVQARVKEWLAPRALGSPPRVVACSLDALTAGQDLDAHILRYLERERLLQKQGCKEVPAPSVFGQSLKTGDILPGCSLAECYQAAIERVKEAPKESQANLLDEVRAWPTKLYAGMPVRVLTLGLMEMINSPETMIVEPLVQLLAAASEVGDRLCVTSSNNIWAARWFVAERINPLLARLGAAPIALGCVGGTHSLMELEGGQPIREEDLASSLSRSSAWNPSAFGTLRFVSSDHEFLSHELISHESGSTATGAPVCPSNQEKDISLAIVGTFESADIYQRAKNMVLLLDIGTFDVRTSDINLRMRNFSASSWVVQGMRGSEFLKFPG